MIDYDPGTWSIGFAFSARGSVFPKSFCIAAPCSFVTFVLHWILHQTDGTERLEKVMDLGTTGASFLGAFTGILGFLIVFRSQQAYARWWGGGSLLFEISGEWINAFSSLLAFSNASPEKKHDVLKFQHLLLRLMSLLHGNALCHIATLKEKVFEFIDLDGFDSAALTFMQDSHDPCQIILMWIQRLIVEANSEETLKVAPPILSRVYNQLGNGIVKVTDAKKMTDYPIPFPLSQMVTVMLLIHLVATSLVCATSIDSQMWAVLLSFLVIMAFWSINFISVELEMPFGDDLNDLPLLDLQRDYNLSLISLMDKRAAGTPYFEYKPAAHFLMHRKGMDLARLLCDQVHDLEPFVGEEAQSSDSPEAKRKARRAVRQTRVSIAQRCAATIGHHKGGGLHINNLSDRSMSLQGARLACLPSRDNLPSHQTQGQPYPPTGHHPSSAELPHIEVAGNSFPLTMFPLGPEDRQEPACPLVVGPLQGQAPEPASSDLSARPEVSGAVSCPSAQKHVLQTL